VIITNFPKQLILDNNKKSKHILPNEQNAYVIKLSDKNFTVDDNGTISANIKIVSEVPENPEKDYIYFVSDNVTDDTATIIHTITEEDKNNIKKLTSTGQGDKFLSDDGSYKSVNHFIQMYYNYKNINTNTTLTDTNDLITNFKAMVYPSILYLEVDNDETFPCNGSLMLYKIGEKSATLTFNGIDNIVYTANIIDNTLSDWHSTELIGAAKKLAQSVKINKADFDGTKDIIASDMKLSKGDDRTYNFSKLTMLNNATYLRFARVKANLTSSANFLINYTSDKSSFNLHYSIGYNSSFKYHQTLYHCINNINNYIRFIKQDEYIYADIALGENIDYATLQVNLISNDWELLDSTVVNPNTLNSQFSVRYKLKDTEDDAEDENSTTTFSRVLDITTDWNDLGLTSEDNLKTGSYMLQLTLNGYIYTGVLSWYKENITNATGVGQEVLLHHSGDGLDSISIFLRTIQKSALELQITANKSILKANCNFVLKKFL
jgi:hypothetical protein